MSKKQLKKFFSGMVKGKTKGRIITFIGSDQTVDRDNDIINLDAWDFTNFMKNPVALLDHNYFNAVDNIVGRAVPRINKQMKRLEFDIEFATKDMNPRADRAFKMAKGGFLNTTSVGFIATSVKWLSEKEADELHDEEPTGRKPRRIFDAVELLEISLVTVPANPNAVRLAYEKGVLDKEEAGEYVKDLREFYKGDPSLNDECDVIEKGLNEDTFVVNKADCDCDDEGVCTFKIADGKVVDAKKKKDIVIEMELSDEMKAIMAKFQKGIDDVTETQNRAIDEINKKIDLVIKDLAHKVPAEPKKKETDKESPGDSGQKPNGATKGHYSRMLLKLGNKLKK